MLGGYADYICLQPEQLVPVPSGLDPAEAVTMVLNYIGKIKPLIATRIPLANMKEPHEMLARGSVTGKLVLLCGDQHA